MADNVKYVTLRDPITNEILVPRMVGSLGYEVIEGETIPPFAMKNDADTLQGHPASDFAEASNSYTKEQILSNETKKLYGLESNAIPDDAFIKINENLNSSVGGITMTLLWENASPTSEFAAQTIYFDYSGYDYLMIICGHMRTSWEIVCTPSFQIGGLFDIRTETTGFLLCNAVAFSRRKFTLVDGGITFGAGQFLSSYNSNAEWSDNAGNAVPFKIYGIKGVQTT